ncbi:hypothetical protein D6051_24030, partial [Salmonella enterica]|nr:hypothetical protein [Salmonella enterica]
LYFFSNFIFLNHVFSYLNQTNFRSDHQINMIATHSSKKSDDQIINLIFAQTDSNQLIDIYVKKLNFIKSVKTGRINWMRKPNGLLRCTPHV